ncbi:MAG TPA: AAA family ATPase [Pyrinomonadaceae bacterium]|nr:AAA family ATPase [Pyrinomonadaceae bacterium]
MNSKSQDLKRPRSLPSVVAWLNRPAAQRVVLALCFGVNALLFIFNGARPNYLAILAAVTGLISSLVLVTLLARWYSHTDYLDIRQYTGVPTPEFWTTYVVAILTVVNTLLSFFKEQLHTTSSKVLFSTSLIVLLMAPMTVRYLYDAVRERLLEKARADVISSLDQRDLEDLDVRIELKEEKAKINFAQNLKSKIVLESFHVRDTVLFPETEWKLQPGVNVLLGRNGYGKSLILRMLAGTLQNDDEVLKTLLQKSGTGLMELHLTRDENGAVVRRNARRFVDSIGKVPLLAIPDSRFVDRSQDVIGPEDNETTDLIVNGAYHFLYQKQYGSVVRGLMYELGLDYWEHGKTFDLPVFDFLEECVRRMTDYDFEFKEITRKGRTGFEIKVRTEGNPEALPIQYASQGTLSVLAMFGLIRSYVRGLSARVDNELVEKGSAIVLIDEADAHLHPAWQQKFPTLLRDLFPNVQFILSAHSPLFVAGCWRGEVAVLRRVQTNTALGGFRLEQPDEDFVGATPADLYQKIFDIEELDATYLEYATKATIQSNRDERIEELIKLKRKDQLSAKQKEELDALELESSRINLAANVQQQRLEESNKDAQIEKLEAKILKLETKIEEQNKNTVS